MMKKISYVVLGLLASAALYFSVLFITIKPIQRASGHSPESYMGLVFLFIMPICLIVGSGITGYLIQPIIGRRSLFTYLIISPGVYAALFILLPTLIEADRLIPSFVIFSVISSLVWGSISVFGTRLGIYLKDRKRMKSDNAFNPDAD